MLDRDGQIQVWRRFLRLAKAIPPTDETAEGTSSRYHLSDEDIWRLANYNLNGVIVFTLLQSWRIAELVFVTEGRVINSVVRTAHSLALSQYVTSSGNHKTLLFSDEDNILTEINH